MAEGAGARAEGAAIGVAATATDEVEAWAAALVATLGGRRLDGLRLVLDLANGAASAVGAPVLASLGAEVVVLGDRPDGTNINDRCGATHPEALQTAVVAEGAHLGIALDGDADRLVMADETGALVDGDQLMAVVARSWQAAGLLNGGAVVATVMSNLGLEEYLSGLGLRLVRTQVGDRYVVERMVADGINLGGEQSGHIVLSDYATTGDGLLAALQVLAVLVGAARPASEVLRPFTPCPQRLKSVAVGAGHPLDAAPVKKAIADAEARLGKRGRLLIRESGTEPVVRVMAEGPDEVLIAGIVDDIAAVIVSAAR